MRLFFQLIENELHIKLQKKKKKNQSCRPHEDLPKLFSTPQLFFESLKLSTTASSISLSEQ